MLRWRVRRWLAILMVVPACDATTLFIDIRLAAGQNALDTVNAIHATR